MGRPKKGLHEPMLALLVLPSDEDVSGLGERLPQDEAKTLGIFMDALERYEEDYASKDRTAEGKSRRAQVRQCFGAVRAAQKLLLIRRQQYYDALVAGVHVKKDGVMDTIRATEESRNGTIDRVRNLQSASNDGGQALRGPAVSG